VMFQEVRYALRLWVGRPWQTGFAIAALAIGIGANTGVFSVVNTLLLRSLPFREPDQLALVRDFIPPHDTAKQFHEWSQQSTYLSDAALFEEIDGNLGGTRVASRVHVAQTSWNFFSVLGTQPVLGRGFASDDDVDATGFGLPGRNAVAVIGYGLWQQLFGADPKALGAIIRIDGHPLTRRGQRREEEGCRRNRSGDDQFRPLGRLSDAIPTCPEARSLFDPTYGCIWAGLVVGCRSRRRSITEIPVKHSSQSGVL